MIGFFDMVYWSRRFRREMAARGASRMGGPPQISVPEIFVDDPDERVGSGAATPATEVADSAPVTPPPGVEQGSSSSSCDAGQESSPSASLRRRESRSNSLTGGEWSPNGKRRVAGPGLQPVETAYHGGAGGRGSESPGRLGPSPSPSHSRHGSSVSARDMLESLDQSAWGESIRRSFSMRRPDSSSQP